MTNPSVSYIDSLKRSVDNAWNTTLYGRWRKMVSSNPLKFYSNEGDSSSLIWMLGRGYRAQNPSNQMKIRCPLLYSDYVSRIWLTYRTNFPLLDGSKKDHDCGWSCMLRSAQMIVAHALTTLKLGRDWRLNLDGANLDIRQIIRLFEDCDEAPLGLHRLITIATKNGVKNPIGQWYSPSQSLVLLRDAVNYSNNPLLKNVKVVVSMEPCLSKHEIESLSDSWRNSLLIFVCLRLGTKNINPVYFNQLRILYTLENSLGMIGGRPRHGVYFVGAHDDKFYCLDPHTSQKYKELNTDASDDNAIWETYHCHFEPSSMKFKELDPSCAIGFLIRNADEFKELINNLSQKSIIELPQEFDSDRNKGNDLPKLFTVVERRPSFTSTALRKLSIESGIDEFEVI